MAEARAARAAGAGARERAAAALLVRGYVAELLPAVLAGLRDQGYLVERIERGQCALTALYSITTAPLAPTERFIVYLYQVSTRSSCLGSSTRFPARSNRLSPAATLSQVPNR